eukprot:s1803_g14.t1
MPPRKKQRSLASSFAASQQGGSDSLPATSMAAVGPFQRDVALCVELMYGLRHGLESEPPSKRPLDDPLVGVGSSGLPQPGEDGLYPFPLLHGGTFMEIAQRAQARPSEDASWLLKESAAMCAAAGLISAPDPVEFHAAYVSTDDTCQLLQRDWPPELGVHFTTSLMCWSFDEKSFWRGKSVAMSEGEVVVARFLQWPPDELDDMSLDGVLLFGDGSQKMLAAISCWVAMLMVWRHHGAECLQEKVVLGMIQSFLEIFTIVKAMDA